jgi:cardiolipin synthase
VVTVPNALSFIRLLGVPLFLWLILNDRDGAAIIVLMVAGWTDYFDGKIARRYNQVSKLGQILDPAADRLYILSTLVGLTIRDVIPLWVPVLLIGRDVVLAATLPLLRRHGYGPLPVSFIGKAATFNLLYAFPFLLLGDGTTRWATVADVFGWAFVLWGTALYLYSGVLYLQHCRQLVGESRERARARERRQARTR